MIRTAAAVAVLLASGLFLQACSRETPGAERPAGWEMRIDNPNDNPDEVRFTREGDDTFHAVMGPAAILYEPARTFSGAAVVSASFTQLKPLDDPEAYGLFVGGSDLQGPAHRYSYFLIRQDGKFLVKKRNGYETPIVINWTEHESITRADASGAMTNALSIHIDQPATSFRVNGVEVASLPTAELDTAGIAGLRINRNLDVRVTGLTYNP
ncbi:MAG: hypothetical protein ACRD26_10060 [Vicinamibacterales bacterium]